MQTVTTTVKVYDFTELSKEAQARVIEDNRDIHVNSWGYWYSEIIREWEEKLGALGYENVDIQFSGFYSQGDGASFTADSLDMRKFLTGKYAPLVKYLDEREDAIIGSVNRFSSHYVHCNTVKANLSEWWTKTDMTPEHVKLLAELEESITEDVRDMSKQIYKELETEYGMLTSDGAIIEYFTENYDAYQFLADGTPYDAREHAEIKYIMEDEQKALATT